MSHQVLARKWRPKAFTQLVGQDHVRLALVNALTQQRLHHAYLFTGTRGVGKTTLARILAKSLNCETGITATPCGVCTACTQIDANRFVDMIELDAASNTGVDNMREILDNAQYAPTSARFKVYIIDEVHMLSKAAFNSMLKTLEEPPAHVKFILATTDPQKIPITVLSRCLQLNLKPLTIRQIQDRLEYVLTQEEIEFELPALSLVAQSARGSMRDSLSLLDQAIAYGHGKVLTDATRGMLGAIDQTYLFKLLEALAHKDGIALLNQIDHIAERGLSFENTLQGLAQLFHRMTIMQIVPEASIDLDDQAREQVYHYSQLFSPEQIQLFYEIVIKGQADLGLAPDESTGFSMILLRLLAFRKSGLNDLLKSPFAQANKINMLGQNSGSALQSSGVVLPQFDDDKKKHELNHIKESYNNIDNLKNHEQNQVETIAQPDHSVEKTSNIQQNLEDWGNIIDKLFPIQSGQNKLLKKGEFKFTDHEKQIGFLLIGELWLNSLKLIENPHIVKSIENYYQSKGFPRFRLMINTTHQTDLSNSPDQIASNQRKTESEELKKQMENDPFVKILIQQLGIEVKSVTLI